MIENIAVKVDDVGRVVIPRKVRRELDINVNDILMLSISEEKILMEKREDNYKLELLIKKLENMINLYDFDIILSNNVEVVFSNIQDLRSLNVDKNIKKIKVGEVFNGENTKITDSFTIDSFHYYCSFYLDVYTKYNLFIICKKQENDVIAKSICDLLLI